MPAVALTAEDAQRLRDFGPGNGIGHELDVAGNPGLLAPSSKPDVMGYRFVSASGAIAAIALTAATGFAFSWLGAAKVRQPDMVGMLSMFWLFPLMLASASTAFAPVDSVPGWLQPFATYQPISVAASAVRGLCNGTAASDDIGLAVAWILGLLAVFGPLSVRIYRNTL